MLAFCCLTLGCQKNNALPVDSEKQQAGSAEVQNGSPENPLLGDSGAPTQEPSSAQIQSSKDDETEQAVSIADTMRLRSEIDSLNADIEDLRQKGRRASKQLKFVSSNISAIRSNGVPEEFFLRQEYADRKANAVAGLRPSLKKFGNALKIGDQKLRQQALIAWIENTEPCFAYGLDATYDIENYEKAATFDLYVSIVNRFFHFENAVNEAEGDSLFTKESLDRVKQDAATFHDELNKTIQALENQKSSQEKQLKELLRLISTKPYAEIEHQRIQDQALVAGATSDGDVVFKSNPDRFDDRVFRFEMTLEGKLYSISVGQDIYPASRPRSSVAAEQFGWSYIPSLPTSPSRGFSSNQVSIRSEYWRGNISQIGDSPEPLQAWMERAESVVAAFGKVASGDFFDGLVQANNGH